MESCTSMDHGAESFDSSKPFYGLVLCCTSIEADQRTEIAQRTADMGGIHKYDLTPDVTHLIVGDYDTAKYRHVAKERPDIKPMAAGWVEAVRTLWMADQEIDFAALEHEWKLRPFESSGGIPSSTLAEDRERKQLICCLTGFEDNETRLMIEDKVTANGGEYTGDLSKKVTHLIVCKPEGKKYVAARKWGIHTVSIEWLHDSAERGMILNEECYDPMLPREERGKGAWNRREVRRVSLGKRLRDGAAPVVEEGRRKLRKTASMKLNSQRDNIWGDILVKHSSADITKPLSTDPSQQMRLMAADQQPEQGGAIFSSCHFYIHGFPIPRKSIVGDFITNNGGQVSPSLDDLASLYRDGSSNHCCLLVPQTSQPDTHPQLPDGVQIVTEFFIERCIYGRKFFSANEHVLGQPFPRFPIDGFENLTINTSGFRDEQLNQVEKTVTQLGAKYAERLNAQSSLLVCPTLKTLHKQKLDFAITMKIPVVNAEWLWQCIRTGCLVPLEDFLFTEISQQLPKERRDMKNEGLHRTRSEPNLKRPMPQQRGPPPRAGVDTTAFDNEPLIHEIPDPDPCGQDTDTPQFETAPTHQADSANNIETVESEPAPLSEVTSNALNKSPPSPRKSQSPRKLKRFPTEGTIGDSEGAEDSDAVSKPSRDDAPVTGETERKRRAERMKDAERQELSKRLDNLVDSGGDGLKPKPSSRAQAPGRRKRAIFGRAASNVSAASSASADSSSLQTTDSNNSPNEPFPPPATQIGYDNPDARRHRDAMMQRINGTKKTSSSVANQRGQEQVTMKSISAAAETASASGASGTRRTMRRR